MITKQEIKNLLTCVQTLAQRRGLTSVHAYRTCCRHLTNAARAQGPARAIGVQHASTHFQILKAAAAEKATRR